MIAVFAWYYRDSLLTIVFLRGVGKLGDLQRSMHLGHPSTNIPRVLYRKSGVCLSSDEDVRLWAVPQGIQVACLADTKLPGEFLSSLKVEFRVTVPLESDGSKSLFTQH